MTIGDETEKCARVCVCLGMTGKGTFWRTRSAQHKMGSAKRVPLKVLITNFFF